MLHKVVWDVLVILIDVLHTVRPALNVGILLLTVTAELPAEEEEQGGEEPGVAQESRGELDGEGNQLIAATMPSFAVEAEDDGHDEERSEDGEHPNSGPELSLFSSKLLSQTETNQGDQSDSAIGKS